MFINLPNFNKSNHSKFYRPDIDGLRAIAVIAVIFFHSHLIGFGGGYVGVDIFFVISGYLITSIILRQLEADNFSLVNFYVRRIRRILPAIIFVSLVCIPIAWVVLTPRDMKDFAQSIAAVSTFSSNILFWKETGYFDQAVGLKPLLHTWSLAVEEQFYALYPLMLIILSFFNRYIKIFSLFIIFILSFSFSVYLQTRDPSGAFYLIFSRAWELLAGSFVAFYFVTHHHSKYPLLNQTLSGFGLMLIFFSIIKFDQYSSQSTYAMIIPVLGTSLVILFADKDTLVSRALSSNVLVSLGLLSYSAYLWHHPILSFFQYIYGSSISTILLSSLGLSSFFLAYPTWRYLENPSRDVNLISNKKMVYTTLFFMSILLAFGITGHLKNGFDFRYSENDKRIINFLSYDVSEIYKEGSCFLRADQDVGEFDQSCLRQNNKSLFLWGDSHAAALSHGLNKNFNQMSQLNSSGCPPIINQPFYSRPNCFEFNNFAVSKIEAHKPKKIIIHSNWISYSKAELNGLNDTILIIKKLSPDSVIYIVGGMPQWKPDLPRLIVKKNLSDISELKKLEISDSVAMYNTDSIISEIALKHRVNFISIFNEICDGDLCSALIPSGIGFEPIVWDYGHLTESGSIYVADKISLKIKD